MPNASSTSWKRNLLSNLTNNDFTIFVIVKTHSYEQKKGKATNKYLENKFAMLQQDSNEQKIVRKSQSNEQTLKSKNCFFWEKYENLNGKIHYGCLHTMCTPISTFFCHTCFLPSYFVNVSTINLNSIHIENKMFKANYALGFIPRWCFQKNNPIVHGIHGTSQLEILWQDWQTRNAFVFDKSWSH